MEPLCYLELASFVRVVYLCANIVNIAVTHPPYLLLIKNKGRNSALYYQNKKMTNFSYQVQQFLFANLSKKPQHFAWVSCLLGKLLVPQLTIKCRRQCG